MATIAVERQEEQITDLYLSAQVTWWEDSSAIERLSLEVVSRAARDAINPTPIEADTTKEAVKAEARAWLISDAAAAWIENAGYSPDQVQDWVNKGCPYLKEASCSNHPREGKGKRGGWETEFF